MGQAGAGRWRPIRAYSLARSGDKLRDCKNVRLAGLEARNHFAGFEFQVTSCGPGTSKVPRVVEAMVETAKTGGGARKLVLRASVVLLFVVSAFLFAHFRTGRAATSVEEMCEKEGAH